MAEDKKVKEENKGAEKPEDKAKREKNLEKQAIILIIILGLILLSFLGAYQLFKPKQYFNYEGFKIYPAKIKGVAEQFYIIPISGGGGSGQVMLRNDPRALNISVEVDELFGGINQVWITRSSDLGSDAVIAGNDLGVFTSRIGLNTSYAFTNSSTETPEINCADATDEARVFLLTLGNETKVYEQDKCIVIQGKNYDEMIKAADMLIVKWLVRLKP